MAGNEKEGIQNVSSLIFVLDQPAVSRVVNHSRGRSEDEDKVDRVMRLGPRDSCETFSSTASVL